MTKWPPGSIIIFIFAIAIGGFLFPNPICFAGQEADMPLEEGVDNRFPRTEIEISVFPTNEEAEKLAEKIRGSGFETFVRSYKTKDERTVFGVFVKIHAETPEPGETERPVGTERTPKDLFSRSASYFHAGLTVSEIYTDNAFNSKKDKKSDLSTVLSPDVWISVPRVNQKPRGLDLIAPRSSGGLLLSKEQWEVPRRYHAFLLYQTDIPVQATNSPSGKMVTHNVQGGFAYNSMSGLSFEMSDEFSRYYETPDTPLLVEPGEVDRYNSNLFYALLSYDTGSRFRFRFDYSHFLLRYDEERNSVRDRVDNSFSSYLFYKLRPKTALFLEYAFTDIAYSEDDALDSIEHDFLLGAEWKITEKSKGSIKAGYGFRDFTDQVTNSDTFVFEGRVEHRFTPKTSLTVTASRRINETNIPSTSFVLTNAVELKYQQMMTSKITGYLAMAYAHDKYGADLTLDGFTAKRKDNLYEISLGLQYEFRKWLRAGIIYLYTNRDSNFPEFSYSKNTLLFRLTGSL